MTVEKVPITEAAERLGLSLSAARKRVQRGTLPAEKDGQGEWLVLLPPPTHGDGQPGTPETARETPAGTDGTVPETPVSDGLMRELVQTLQRENERLWDELSARDRELELRAEESRRKDYIIADLTRRLPELPSPAAGSQPTEIGEDTQTGWWQRVHLWGRRAVSALVVAGND